MAGLPNTELSVNRLAINQPDRVQGSVEELVELGLEVDGWLSCGPPIQGVARCPFAKVCTQSYKGQKGYYTAIDVDPDTHKVKVDEDGNGVPVEKVACGPRTLAVYHKDPSAKAGRILKMACFDYYAARRRWDGSVPAGQPQHLVQILGIEGDGKEFPTKETVEIPKTNAAGQPVFETNGRQKIEVHHVAPKRALMFFQRPGEHLEEERIEHEVRTVSAQDDQRRAAAILQGLAPEDRPIQVASLGKEVPNAARRAAREAKV